MQGVYYEFDIVDKNKIFIFMLGMSVLHLEHNRI